MNDQRKLWRDMTDAEQGALLLAYHRGKDIECNNWMNDDLGWIIIEEPSWPSWADNCAYRVKPEPRMSHG
jgi:hypothetical protein